MRAWILKSLKMVTVRNGEQVIGRKTNHPAYPSFAIGFEPPFFNSVVAAVRLGADR